MKVLISDDAEQDLINGSRFYESQSPGLGETFLDTLFADIESLRLYTGIHVRHFGHFRLLSGRGSRRFVATGMPFNLEETNPWQRFDSRRR